MFLLKIAFGALILASSSVFGETNTVGSEMAKTFSRDESGHFSLLGKNMSKPQQEQELFANLNETNVFISINGKDNLTWGDIKSYCEPMVGKMAKSFAVPGADGNKIKNGIYRQIISKLLKEYICVSVIAGEAKNRGIKVESREIDTMRERMQKRRLVDGSFFEQYLTNLVLQSNYVSKFIKPSIVVSNEEIKATIAARHKTNLSVPLTNTIFRATMEKVRSDILASKITFEAAVEQYSECVDCVTDGGNCGTWYEEDDREEVLMKAAFGLKLNELSKVIEGEDAFHLIKVVSKYEPKNTDEGEERSVDVRHIQIDKWMPDPEYTEETAKAVVFGKKLKLNLKRRQMELLKAAKIDSLVPLFEGGKGAKKGPTKRIFK